MLFNHRPVSFAEYKKGPCYKIASYVPWASLTRSKRSLRTGRQRSSSSPCSTCRRWRHRWWRWQCSSRCRTRGGRNCFYAECCGGRHFEIGFRTFWILILTLQQFGQNPNPSQKFGWNYPCSSWCWSSCCWSAWRASLGRRKTVFGRSPWELLERGRTITFNLPPFITPN